MGETVEAKLHGNVVYRTVSGVQQSHGAVQSTLKNILMERHTRMLEHKFIQIIWVVVQICADLPVGNASHSVGVDILDDLAYYIVMDVA